MATENSLSKEKIINHQEMNHWTQKEEETIENKGMNKNCLSVCLWDLVLEKITKLISRIVLKKTIMLFISHLSKTRKKIVSINTEQAFGIFQQTLTIK